MKDDIKKIADELMEKMGIEAQIEVTEDKAEDNQTVFMVGIDSPREAGLLIGAHGATLHAIQSFIAMAVKQKTGEWVRVVVDIGQWRQKHDEHLAGLAQQAAERAKQTGEVQMLYNLTPAQRRVVHLALSKEEGIETASEGEGESRYLVVKPV